MQGVINDYITQLKDMLDDVQEEFKNRTDANFLADKQQEAMNRLAKIHFELICLCQAACSIQAPEVRDD